MTFPTTLSVSKLLARLGVKSWEVPEMNVSSYTPVVIMADFSRSLTAEPFEARAIAGEYIDSVPSGDVIGFSLQAIAPGGVIIEEWSLSHPEYSNTPIVVAVGTFDEEKLTSPTPLGTSILQDIGGTWPRTIVRYGYRNNPPANTAWMTSARGDAHVRMTDQRIWVKPGEFFIVTSTHDNLKGGFHVVFRELPEVQGPP